MSGIFGVIYFDNRPIEKKLLQGMGNIILHRGPHGEGIHINSNAKKKWSVGLGFRWLNLYNRHSEVPQPISNEDESIFLVCDGEVYNSKPLETSLKSSGHRFKGDDATEVILHLYEEYGEECLSYLRGGFAFALWDEGNSKILLARDHLGIKPLFYYLNTNCLLFASEIKSIFKIPELTPEPDLEAIHHYLTYQCVPDPYSAFKGVRKLSPASKLTIENGSCRIQRYWNLHFAEKRELSEPEWCEELTSKLYETVSTHLNDGVVPGLFLSGGVDSSVMMYLLTQLVKQPIKTFSIGFEEEEYSELPYSRMVANQFQSHHHEFIVKPEVAEIIPRMVWHYNEPYADSSALCTYFVSKVSREHCKLVFLGDAGDENFAGYERYVGATLLERTNRIPKIPRKLLEYIANLLPDPKNTKGLYRNAKRFLANVSQPPLSRYCSWISHFDNLLKKELYSEEFFKVYGPIDSTELFKKALQASDAKTYTEAFILAEINTLLPWDLIVKVEVATMANSQVARSPMLDRKFMEFTAKIPLYNKIKGMDKKYIFKKAFTSILPNEVLYKPKWGFGVPIDYWFREPLKEMVYDILLSKRLRDRGLFKPQFVEKMVKEHSQGIRNWHYQLWNLLMLELWFREFIDNQQS